MLFNGVYAKYVPYGHPSFMFVSYHCWVEEGDNRDKLSLAQALHYHGLPWTLMVVEHPLWAERQVKVGCICYSFLAAYLPQLPGEAMARVATFDGPFTCDPLG